MANMVPDGRRKLPFVEQPWVAAVNIPPHLLAERSSFPGISSLYLRV
ncbi:hypothetical protein [Candidatus Poriferisodalis sp.]